MLKVAEGDKVKAGQLLAEWDFLIDEQVEKHIFERGNQRVIERGGKPGIAEPLLLGITNASAGTVDIDAKVALAAAKIHEQAPNVTVFAPSRVPGTEGKVFVSGRAYDNDKDGTFTYSISFDYVEGCGGSNACSFGDISSSQSAPWFKPNAGVDEVAVMFQEMICGASCAPPSVTWSDARKATFYTLSLKGGTRESLTNLLRSTLKAGARK